MVDKVVVLQELLVMLTLHLQVQSTMLILTKMKFLLEHHLTVIDGQIFQTMVLVCYSCSDAGILVPTYDWTTNTPYNSTSNYSTINGTSFSGPIVTGIVAVGRQEWICSNNKSTLHYQKFC